MARTRATLGLVLALVLFLFARVASANPWTPPPLKGHVVDQAGALDARQVSALDRKLDLARRQSGFAVVVYLMAQLPEGMPIEDVGYAAGQAWGVGSKDGDDGVLLLASLGDRKVRIETGKGVGGALTDVQSSHINREIIGPLFAAGKTYEAMDRGVDAILKELRENTPGGVSEKGKDPSASQRTQKAPKAKAPASPTSAGELVKVGVVVALIVGVIALAIVSPAFREILFWVLLFGRFGGGGGGGGGSRDDDDDGGSGYGGGGGTFGGGGSSDDY